MLAETMEASRDRLLRRVTAFAATMFALAFLTGCLGDPLPPVTPAVVAGRAYARQGTGLVVLDARSGDVVRRVPTEGSDETPPAAFERFLYAGHRELQAVDVVTGAVAWSTPPRTGVTNQHIVVDAQHVYFMAVTDSVAGNDTRLVVLDRATGRELWSEAAPRAHKAIPAGEVVLVSGGTLFSPTIVARDAATGAQRWTTPNPYARRPVVAGGRIFVLTVGEARELDLATGRETWRDPMGEGIRIAAAGSTLYLSRGAKLQAVDLATKQQRWLEPCGGQLAASDAIVVCANWSSATARRADTGELMWRFELPDVRWAPPVLSDGVLLLRGYPGRMLAIDAGTGKALWRLDLEKDGAPPSGPLALREDGSVVLDGKRVSLEEVTRCSPAAHDEALRAGRSEVASYVVLGAGILGALASCTMLGIAGLSKSPQPTLTVVGIGGDVGSIAAIGGGLVGLWAGRDHARRAVQLYNRGSCDRN